MTIYEEKTKNNVQPKPVSKSNNDNSIRTWIDIISVLDNTSFMNGFTENHMMAMSLLSCHTSGKSYKSKVQVLSDYKI